MTFLLIIFFKQYDRVGKKNITLPVILLKATTRISQSNQM